MADGASPTPLEAVSSQSVTSKTEESPVTSGSMDSQITPDLGRVTTAELDTRVRSLVQALRDQPSEGDLLSAQTEEEQKLFHGAEMTARSEIRAWYLVDWANSPMWNVLLGFILPLYFADLATQYACSHGADNGCDVDGQLIGSSDTVEVDVGIVSVVPVSFALTMISIAGITQLVGYLLCGALADYSFYSHYLFRITATMGAVMVGVWCFVTDSKHYLFAGIWLTVQVLFFGLGIIFYNAMLPKMVENHWLVRRAVRGKKSAVALSKMKQQLADDVSQYGFSIGYCGSTVVVVITFVVLTITEQTQYQQFDGFGVTSGDGIESFDEQWLKEVNRVDMAFDDEHLTKIQFFYESLTVNGTVFGDESASTTDSFMTADSRYITEIEFWVNDGDGYLNGLRFSTQNGTASSVFAAASWDNESDAESMRGESDDYVLSGYTVYVDNESISGMDTLMLNQGVGQITSNLPYRIVIGIVFVWWNLFQFISFKYLKRRDGPPLPEDNNNVLLFSLRAYFKTFKEAKKYPNLLRFLVCWFFFSDGVATSGQVGALFGATELGMTPAENSIMYLVGLLTGSIGCVLFLWIQKKIDWSCRQMMILHCVAMAVLATYPVFGLFPGSPIGLVSKMEFYIYVFFWSLNFGSLQSYARSMMASIVPIGKEAEMFALYEITDKGSSWIGPLTVAIITNRASIRFGMIYCSLFFIIPIPILWLGIDEVMAVKESGRADMETQEATTAGRGTRSKDEQVMVGIQETAANQSE